MKHTDLPWEVAYDTYPTNSNGADIWGPPENGDDDAGPWPVVAQQCTKENAEFIVRAANSHLALVDALEEVEWSGGAVAGSPICPSCGARQRRDYHAETCKLRAALALARGEE